MNSKYFSNFFSPQLEPNASLLKDKRVLSQAWKKTNIFLRHNNSYTDLLDIEYYSFNISKNLKTLSEITEQNISKKIKTIPSPKSSTWEFSKEDDNVLIEDFNLWKSSKPEELEMRPISLIPIDLQVKLTSAVMCIAEAIESIQGDIKNETEDIINSQNSSYGNRLMCIWNNENGKDKAIFHAGSSELYEPYYKNYNNFLKRPFKIAKYYSSCMSSSNKIYLVNLDIAKFYDTIDCKRLIQTLESSLTKYYQNNKKIEVKEFIDHLEKLLDFEYTDAEEYKLLFNTLNGLPQGLAASGVLANAYMLEFDQNLTKTRNCDHYIIHDKIKEKSSYLKEKSLKEEDVNKELFIIRDYCRYVDDLRLVIEINKDIPYEKVKSIILDFINDTLNRSINDQTKFDQKLTFNNKKYEVYDYQKFLEKPISQQLHSHRALLSGIPTVEDINANLDSLKSLFINTMLKNNSKSENRLKLSSVNSAPWNVKDSTIKKFIATDFKKHLDIKTKTTPSNQFTNNEINYGYEELLYEKINISKLLIEAWATDPFLTYLLKLSFEINPCSKNLATVIEALKTKLIPSSNLTSIQLKEKYIAIYIACYLFDIGTDFIFKEKKEQSSRYKCFLELLSDFGLMIINKFPEDTPYYLLNKIILYLESIKFKFTLPKDYTKYYGENYYTKLVNLHSPLQSLKINSEEDVFNRKETEVEKILFLGLIAHNIYMTDSEFIIWFIRLLNSLEFHYKELITKKLYEENNILFRKVFSNNCGIEIEEKIKLISKYHPYLNFYQTKNINLVNDKKISLLRIILSNKNPFNQENALLLLTKSLLNKINVLNDINILNIDVSCKDWSNIQNPHYYKGNYFEIHINNNNKYDPIFNILPFWLTEANHLTKSCDSCLDPLFETNNLTYYQALYNIGSILRSCILGDFHYTSTRGMLNETYINYFGYKTSYYSRTFGLDNSLRQLSNKIHPITPWFGEFLFYCLRWPYAHFTLEMEVKYNNISNLIRERIAHQKAIYGRLTDLPMYIFPVKVNELNDTNKIKVGIVQPILPTGFDVKNPIYWSETDRLLQRNHLIHLCNLIERQMCAYNIANIKNNFVDLLVFPEVSIHKDDIDILKKLAQKLKTNIFAGLMFIQNPEKSNEIINQALWLIRNNDNEFEELIEIYQGKQNMTKHENKMKIKGHRPYQLIIQFNNQLGNSWKVSGSICYDSTDLKLGADLRDITDAFVIAAYNEDVKTFDNMASALSYHMYQPIILSNIGVYGGSTIQAPYSGHDKIIAHLHGINQIGFGIFELDINEFKSIDTPPATKKTKSPPAGYIGRNLSKLK